jgi:hypothetical protein
MVRYTALVAKDDEHAIEQAIDTEYNHGGFQFTQRIPIEGIDWYAYVVKYHKPVNAESMPDDWRQM